MFYLFGLIYIALCLYRISVASVSLPTRNTTFLDIVSLITTTAYVLVGMKYINTPVFLFIALAWLITTNYFPDHKKLFIFRMLINVALVLIILVEQLIELITI